MTELNEKKRAVRNSNGYEKLSTNDSEYIVEGFSEENSSCDCFEEKSSEFDKYAFSDADDYEEPCDEKEDLDNQERGVILEDWQALMHIFKAFVGTGILGLPSAVMHGGIILGPLMLFVMAITCMLNIQLLVITRRKICEQLKIRTLTYGELSGEMFSIFGKHIGNIAMFVTNAFLVTLQVGFCCVYVVFITENVQKVVGEFDLRIYMLILFPLLFVPGMMTSIRRLAYLTSIGNFIIVCGLLVIYQYLIRHLQNPLTLPPYKPFGDFAIGFGQMVYAFEGIAMVLPAESRMRRPDDLAWIMRVVTAVVTMMYFSLGVLGYMTFADETEGSISLNLPKTALYGTLQTLFAFVVYLTYPLQMYVSIEIIQPWIIAASPARLKKLSPYLLRASIVTITCLVALGIPQLDNFMALVGSLSGAAIALILPPILHTLCFWNEGLTRFEHYRNLTMVCVGIFGATTGTISAVRAISRRFHDCPDQTKPS